MVGRLEIVFVLAVASGCAGGEGGTADAGQVDSLEGLFGCFAYKGGDWHGDQGCGFTRMTIVLRETYFSADPLGLDPSQRFDFYVFPNPLQAVGHGDLTIDGYRTSFICDLVCDGGGRLTLDCDNQYGTWHGCTEVFERAE